MKNCFECGDLAIHNHHVVPRSLGGKKTIPLCANCHSKAHNNLKLFTADHAILIKQGLERAKANGITLGRPNTGKNTFISIRMTKEEKLYLKNTAKFLGKSMSDYVLDLMLKKV